MTSSSLANLNPSPLPDVLDVSQPTARIALLRRALQQPVNDPADASPVSRQISLQRMMDRLLHEQATARKLRVVALTGGR